MEVGRKRGERISKGWMRRRVEKKMENNDQEKERKSGCIITNCRQCSAPVT